MKNLIFTLALIFIHFSNYAQTFDDIYIGGDLSTCMTRLKAKGYKLVTMIENNTAAMFRGNVGSVDIDLLVISTPKTKKVFTFGIYMSEENNFNSLKRTSDKYFEILVNKYGEPDDISLDFESPYYLGDGFEITALKSGKCKYSATWDEKNNMNIRLQINKFSQVQISYDNIKNVELYINEQNSIERTIYIP
jgi:hypothetical protein